MLTSGRIFKLVLLLGALCLAAYLWTGVEWYASGPAQLPVPSPIETSLASIQAIHLGELSQTDEFQMTAGSDFHVTGILATEVAHWAWVERPSPRLSSLEKQKFYREREKRDAGKASMNLEFDIVSRTWLAPGYQSGIVDHGKSEGDPHAKVGVGWTRTIAKCKRTGENTISFRAELSTPDRPGQYELRAILRQSFKDTHYSEDIETIIGAYIINVSP